MEGGMEEDCKKSWGKYENNDAFYVPSSSDCILLAIALRL